MKQRESRAGGARGRNVGTRCVFDPEREKTCRVALYAWRAPHPGQAAAPLALVDGERVNQGP